MAGDWPTYPPFKAPTPPRGTLGDHPIQYCKRFFLLWLLLGLYFNSPEQMLIQPLPTKSKFLAVMKPKTGSFPVFRIRLGD